jgi:pilus assembly protein Flp/PilA
MAITRLIKRFIKAEKGATAIEYALIASIVAIGIVVSLGTLKTGLNTLYTSVNTSLTK